MSQSNDIELTENDLKQIVIEKYYLALSCLENQVKLYNRTLS